MKKNLADQKTGIFKNNRFQIKAIFKNHKYPFEAECDITEKNHIQKQRIVIRMEKYTMYTG
jgi:hypothetical protein